MWMLTLAISCLTTSNLPWFMDLTFQVPMQYCSLQHWTLIHGPNIPGFYATLFFTASDLASITSHILNWMLFCFGSISSVFQELFLHSSPGAHWTATDLGSSSFSVLSFSLFMLFMGFSGQEHWSGLPFPSPMEHILSELSTMTRLYWVALKQHDS